MPPIDEVQHLTASLGGKDQPIQRQETNLTIPSDELFDILVHISYDVQIG